MHFKTTLTLKLTLFLSIVIICIGCEDNFKNIQDFNKTTFFPVGEAQNIYTQYIDSGRIKAILVSPQMFDYSNVYNSYIEFPSGVSLTLYDEFKNENTVEADYAISYNKTELIDLRGNVVITTHQGRKLEADQLYYDQKNDWFYTLGKYKASTDNDNFTQGIGVDFDSKLNTVKAQNSYAESIKKEN